MKQFILIPHIKIHNANALSSPYTIGFPAMTAWLGAVHALQRSMHQKGFANIKFVSVAISCHQFDLQTYKGEGDFVDSIVGAAHPLDKDGGRPSFIEEARCHLEVSLLIEYRGLYSDDHENFENIINRQIMCMKFAGGDVISNKPVELLPFDNDNDKDLKKILHKLMLGYVIVERRELIRQAMQDENKDALDALLDYLKVTHRSCELANKVVWTGMRKTSGWLVPIAVGFQGISDLGIAQNQRDTRTSHRFAESVITLGQFVMPYRISNLDEILWHYYVDTKKNLYLCKAICSN